jgi:hypothetical protein
MFILLYLHVNKIKNRFYRYLDYRDKRITIYLDFFVHFVIGYTKDALLNEKPSF